MVLLLSGRANGFFGDGGGGALVGTEASPVPPGPRGWDSRAPIFESRKREFTLLLPKEESRRMYQASMKMYELSFWELGFGPWVAHWYSCTIVLALAFLQHHLSRPTKAHVSYATDRSEVCTWFCSTMLSSKV